MAPYMILSLGIGTLGLAMCEKNNSAKNNRLFLCISTLAMLAMVIFRGASVGVDYGFVYENYFTYVSTQDFSFLASPDNLYRTEPGFGLLVFLFSRVTSSPMVIAALISSLIVLLRMFAVYRQSAIIWLSVFLYSTFGFFGYALCTLRQELGISILFFAFPFLQKRKILPYMAIVLLAAMFHSSMLVMIPVYFVAHIPLNKWMIALYAFGTAFVTIFSIPIMELVIKILPRFAKYAPGTYYMQGRDFPTIVAPLLCFALMIFLYRKTIACNKENIVLVNLYTYGTIFWVLTMKHFIFQRIALIFFPVVILLIPQLLKGLVYDELKASKAQIRTNKEVYILVYGVIIAIAYGYLIFLLSSNRLDLVPYIPFWS